jgi:putative transposon-encoded protein
MEIKIKGYAVIEKTVKKSGTSGSIYVPKEWIGKRVKIILIEDLDVSGQYSTN